MKEHEKAFYDALNCNKKLQELMKDAKLAEIAKELVYLVKGKDTIEWTIRQKAKDKVRLEVKRILRLHKYPPDDIPKAVEIMIGQAGIFTQELM